MGRNRAITDKRECSLSKASMATPNMINVFCSLHHKPGNISSNVRLRTKPRNMNIEDVWIDERKEGNTSQEETRELSINI